MEFLRLGDSGTLHVWWDTWVFCEEHDQAAIGIYTETSIYNSFVTFETTIFGLLIFGPRFWILRLTWNLILAFETVFLNFEIWDLKCDVNLIFWNWFLNFEIETWKLIFELGFETVFYLWFWYLKLIVWILRMRREIWFCWILDFKLISEFWDWDLTFFFLILRLRPEFWLF